MSKKYVHDMTEGNEISLLVRFSLPMLIGNIFQQFYNLIDSIVVGRYIGANALAAAMSTFTGQNIGANKLNRVKEGYHKSILIVIR